MRISDWSSDVCSADLLAGLSHYRINGRSDKFDQAKSPLTADGRHRKPNAVHTGCKDVAMNFRNGLSSLLRPEDSVLLLIDHQPRSEEHMSELQSLMRISFAVFCLKQKNAIDHK